VRTTTLLAALLFLSASPAFADLVTLHALSSADGSRAHELVLASDGNFYGTTIFGGANDLGTVFRMSPEGTFTVVADFDGNNGAIPLGGLTIGKDGNLYGTTYRGGTSDSGTFFQIQPGGPLVTLSSFDPSTGLSHPNSTMRTGLDQSLYGTTEGGMTFQASFDGTLTPWAFVGGDPQSLIMGNDGKFYGTTLSGGPNHAGDIFRLWWPGASLDEPHAFTSETQIYGRLLQGSDGNLYGTINSFGGACCGAVFSLEKDGAYRFRIIATFDGTNGSYPQSGLVEGPDGSFYGTTASGGANNDGTIFRVTPDGQLTTLVSFERASTGSWLAFDLALENDGHLYGSTLLGGQYDNGTIFRADAVTVSAAPNVTFEASPTTIALGQSATLTWSVRDSAACQGDGEWTGYVPSSGTRLVTPTTAGTHSYGLICRNVKGSVGTGAAITVKDWAAPAWQSPTPAEGAVVDTTVTVPFTRTIQASVDAGGDRMHFDLTNAPSGMSISTLSDYPPSVTLNWTPAQVGTYDVTVRGTDLASQVISRSFKVRVNKRPTKLDAKAEILTVSTETVHLRMKAVLDAANPNQPLAGKTVKFTAPNGNLLCSAVTDGTGTAACGDPTTYLRTAINQSYVATFGGDSQYLGSTTSAALIK